MRIAEMILYFFYKNMLFTLPQIFFGIQCAFSGQTLYEDYYVTSFNLVFTSLPLVAKAILEQDINYKRVRKSTVFEPPGIQIEEDGGIKDYFPTLYRENKENLIFTIKSFSVWILEGVIVSALIYLFGLYILTDAVINKEGLTGGIWYFSIALYTTVIVVSLVLYKVSLTCCRSSMSSSRCTREPGQLSSV